MCVLLCSIPLILENQYGPGVSFRASQLERGRTHDWGSPTSLSPCPPWSDLRCLDTPLGHPCWDTGVSSPSTFTTPLVIPVSPSFSSNVAESGSASKVVATADHGCRLFVCLFVVIKPRKSFLRLLLWPRSKTEFRTLVNFFFPCRFAATQLAQKCWKNHTGFFLCLFVYEYETRKSLLRLPPWPRSKTPGNVYPLGPRSSSCGPTKGTTPPRTASCTNFRLTLYKLTGWLASLDLWKPHTGASWATEQRSDISLV